jgi:DNA-binding transcriptional regulator YhcF (GntR family)
MEFKADRPIYMQIVDFCFQRILTKEWKENERIPSVRELGMLLQVNPNTAMRAFEYLQSEDIIYLKRGTGYFVQQDAYSRISDIQKKDFFDVTLSEIFDFMDLLNVKIEDVIEKYNNRKIKKS